MRCPNSPFSLLTVSYRSPCYCRSRLRLGCTPNLARLLPLSTTKLRIFRADTSPGEVIRPIPIVSYHLTGQDLTWRDCGCQFSAPATCLLVETAAPPVPCSGREQICPNYVNLPEQSGLAGQRNFLQFSERFSAVTKTAATASASGTDTPFCLPQQTPARNQSTLPAVTRPDPAPRIYRSSETRTGSTRSILRDRSRN